MLCGAIGDQLPIIICTLCSLPSYIWTIISLVCYFYVEFELKRIGSYSRAMRGQKFKRLSSTDWALGIAGGPLISSATAASSPSTAPASRPVSGSSNGGELSTVRSLLGMAMPFNRCSVDLPSSPSSTSSPSMQALSLAARSSTSPADLGGGTYAAFTDSPTTGASANSQPEDPASDDEEPESLEVRFSTEISL